MTASHTITAPAVTPLYATEFYRDHLAWRRDQAFRAERIAADPLQFCGNCEGLLVRGFCPDCAERDS